MHKRILQIDKIEDIISSVEKNTGISPVNISHWDSGEKYQELLMQKFIVPSMENISNYIYSYDISSKIKSELLIKMNYKVHNNACALFTSATNAISNIIILLMKIHANNILILRPVYYTVYENLLYFSEFKVTLRDLKYDNTTGKYHIPVSELKKCNYDVLWITQPVFSAGVYISISEIYDVCKIFDLIVLDCSLCSINNFKILNNILPENVIVIGCPHKLIGVNGIKFCFVFACQNIIDILEDVIDIFTGSLPVTVALAIKHFLNDNYDECYLFNEQYVNNLKKNCECLYDKYYDIVEYNKNATGMYGLVRLRAYEYIETINFNSFEKMVYNTFSAFIPNNLNNGLKENGYCFRVNYTLDENILLPALSRLFTYFDENHPEL